MFASTSAHAASSSLPPHSQSLPGPVTLDSVLQSAKRGLQYHIIGSDGFSISAESPEDHLMAMEALDRIAAFERQRASRLSAIQVERPAVTSVMPEAVSIPVQGPTIIQPSMQPSDESLDAPFGVATAPFPTEPPPASIAPMAPVEMVTSSSDRAHDLKSLASVHLANQARGGKKLSSTIEEVKFVVELFIELVGNKAANQVTFADIGLFADAIAIWPAHLRHRHDVTDMSYSSILAKAKAEKLKAIELGTQNKHIQYLSKFFNWMVETKVISANPVQSIDRSQYVDPNHEPKEPFSNKDVDLIFEASRVNNYAEPYKLWGPLIAYYTGMRANEVAQLYINDIKAVQWKNQQNELEDVPCFSISNYREGQRVKSVYSVRDMPIHSRLIELGFLDYVEDVRAKGSKHLFPGLPWRENGPARSLYSWFNKEVLRKACLITSRTKSFHCFRHFLTTMSERNRVPNSIITAINGHSPGEGIDKKVYVARGNVLEIRDWLEQLPFPALQIKRYERGRFERYLRHAVAEERTNEDRAKQGKPRVARRGRRSNEIPADWVLDDAVEPVKKSKTKLATTSRRIQ